MTPPLSDMPKAIGSTNYVRTTKLVGKWFIPIDFKDIIEETRKDGTKYRTYLFQIFLIDEQIYIELRTTHRWYVQFSSFLTTELQKAFENKEKMMYYKMQGYGSELVYHFLAEKYGEKVKGSVKKYQLKKK